MTGDRIDKDREELEQTRREWLRRVTEVSALAGVAGLVPDLGEALTRQSGAPPPPPGLPPGVWEPATDHLSHVLSAQDAPIIPPGTETDYVRPRVGPFQPQFFTPAELPVVTALVGIVLGTVDRAALADTVEWIDRYLHTAAGVREHTRQLTALQRSAAAAYFGENRVRQLETEDPQGIAREGLRAVDRHAREGSGSVFLQSSAEQQATVVREMSTAPPGSSLRRWYDLLRREAVRGYYTTRAGLQELQYKGNTFYGICPGCTLTKSGS